MKRFSLLVTIIVIVTVFSYCNTAKKAAAAPVISYSYQQDVMPLVEAHCSPCHLPAKGGKKLSLDNYESMRTNIDDVIRRIELNPGDRGFMPFKHPKLSDSTINVFKAWKSSGMNKIK